MYVLMQYIYIYIYVYVACHLVNANTTFLIKCDRYNVTICINIRNLKIVYSSLLEIKITSLFSYITQRDA
jgi:hypothetical protein